MDANLALLNAKTHDWTMTVYDAMVATLHQANQPSMSEFASLAERVIAKARQKNLDLRGRTPWLSLPLAVAEATGGVPDAAIHVGAGFEFARISAGILDQCMDQDTDGALWTQIGMAQAINLAVGLTSLALISISDLQQHGVSAEKESRIRAEFEQTWFRMCEGQQKELSITNSDEVSESVYWDIASAKSGKFFELGCTAAAMLSDDLCAEALEGYRAFGHHVGIAIQLMNDLEGLWGVRGKKDIGQRITLPIIYARSRLADTERNKLDCLLRRAATDATAITAATEIIEQAGAVEYVCLQMQIYRNRAIQSLAYCSKPTILLALLDSLLPLSSDVPDVPTT